MTVTLEPATLQPPGTTAPSRAAVLARAVVKRHRNGRGVGPIDISVDAGEVLALMGRNGSGKTTLLRVLATVTPPGSGRVSWFGGGAAAARRRVGVALDAALEEGGLTGRQATHFWCAQWIGEHADVVRRTASILERLGLAAAADEPVATYSFGMRRRLALAAALVHGPDLVVLDEPTAGLDPEGVALLRSLLEERTRRGRTSVVASNDAAFVESAAARVAFLEEGLLVALATPGELLARLPGGRAATIVVDGRCDAARLRAVPGVLEVAGDGGTALVQLEGDHVLAALVAAADAPGGRLRELHLRRPDLTDCFRHLTGRTLEEGA